MKCIDECKKGADKEDTCECDVSDTESVASLTEAEMDKLIRDTSNKVLKATDKPTNVREKKDDSRKGDRECRILLCIFKGGGFLTRRVSGLGSLHKDTKQNNLGI
jgi:hypothetical protein